LEAPGLACVVERMRLKCTKCKLSAVCLGVGGPSELGALFWRCKDCKKLFLKKEYHEPYSSLASLVLPEECGEVLEKKLDLNVFGVCYECYHKDVAKTAS